MQHLLSTVHRCFDPDCERHVKRCYINGNETSERWIIFRCQETACPPSLKYISSKTERASYTHMINILITEYPRYEHAPSPPRTRKQSKGTNQIPRAISSDSGLLWDPSFTSSITSPLSVCRWARGAAAHSLKPFSRLLRKARQLLRGVRTGSAKDGIRAVGGGEWIRGSVTSILQTGHCPALAG